MFRRLLIEDSAAWFTIIAFVTALAIYLAFTWRALRMKRSQVSHFEGLPFETETPAAGRDGRAGRSARGPKIILETQDATQGTARPTDVSS